MRMPASRDGLRKNRMNKTGSNIFKRKFAKKLRKIGN